MQFAHTEALFFLLPARYFLVKKIRSALRPPTSVLCGKTLAFSGCPEKTLAATEAFPEVIPRRFSWKSREKAG